MVLQGNPTDTLTLSFPSNSVLYFNSDDIRMLIILIVVSFFNNNYLNINQLKFERNNFL